MDAQCGSSKKYIKVIAYEVDLTVSKLSLTLKEDCDVEFEILTEPASAFTGVATPTVQIQRVGIGATDWLPLLEGAGTVNWTARVAGVFQLRLKTQVNGTDFVTPTKAMIVSFPKYEQIKSDASVISGIMLEWQRTLDDCTQVPNRRRERGAWITLNTAGSGAYSYSSVSPGPWVGTDPSENTAIELGARPYAKLSDIAPNASSAVYTVASFHTHTSPEYITWGFAGGPSVDDQTADAAQNVAGIVFDYVQRPVPAGHPKNSLATLYATKLQREPSAE